MFKRAIQDSIRIEVKWTHNIRDADTKHLKLFLKDQPEFRQDFMVARVDYPIMVSDKIMVLPWKDIKLVWDKAKSA